jgi:serine/threonine protein kinase
VLERLGSGGMGNVFLCEHKVMRRRVAIKVLATVVADDPAGLKRFQREARAAAGLDHPNIVRAHDIGQEEKLHYLVMDYVDGTCLQDVLKKFGRMDIVRAAHYIKQAASGLQHAHGAGLIHRDIKPANLILDRTGVVKVLDMGIARFSESDEEVLTRGPLGTADYLAPEQARDSHNVDLRADIYSLGATFYTMLTGRLPFADAKTVSQKLIFLQTKQPMPVRTLRPEIPEGIAAVVEKMMAKDPKQRYQTLNEVVRDLEPFTSHAIAPPPEREMPELSPALLAPAPITESSAGMDLKSPSVAKPPQRKNGLLVGAAFVVVLVVVGAWVWWTYLRPHQ